MKSHKELKIKKFSILDIIIYSLSFLSFVLMVIVLYNNRTYDDEMTNNNDIVINDNITNNNLNETEDLSDKNAKEKKVKLVFNDKKEYDEKSNKLKTPLATDFYKNKTDFENVKKDHEKKDIDITNNKSHKTDYNKTISIKDKKHVNIKKDYLIKTSYKKKLDKKKTDFQKDKEIKNIGGLKSKKNNKKSSIKKAIFKKDKEILSKLKKISNNKTEKKTEKKINKKAYKKANVKKSTKSTIKKTNKTKNIDKLNQKRDIIIYKVKKGDSLWNISLKNKIDFNELLRLNSLKNPDLIFPGDNIKLYS